MDTPELLTDYELEFLMAMGEVHGRSQSIWSQLGHELRNATTPEDKAFWMRLKNIMDRLPSFPKGEELRHMLVERRQQDWRD